MFIFETLHTVDETVWKFYLTIDNAQHSKR